MNNNNTLPLYTAIINKYALEKKNNASGENVKNVAKITEKLPMYLQCFPTVECNVLMIMIRKTHLIPSSCWLFQG